MAPSADVAPGDKEAPVTRPGRTEIMRWTSLLFVAVLMAACSGEPQSQARASEAPSGAPASEAAQSEVPASEPAATEAPSEAVATPEPSPSPATTAPPKPADVTWKQVGTQALAGGQTRVTHRITWTAPVGGATSFSVYGVTDCLRNAKKYDGKPCVVKGMRIPKASLRLIAEVPGSLRTVDIAWKEGEAGPGPYGAVLVRASNAAGDSIFTIAWSAAVCWQCTS